MIATPLLMLCFTPFRDITDYAAADMMSLSFMMHAPIRHD